MKVQQVEVRTIYEVSVSFTDFIQCVTEYQTDDMAKMMYPEAFPFEFSEDMSVSVLHANFENCRDWHSHTWSALARFLKYDGYSRAGMVDRVTGEIVCQMFRHGDAIN